MSMDDKVPTISAIQLNYDKRHRRIHYFGRDRRMGSRT